MINFWSYKDEYKRYKSSLLIFLIILLKMVKFFLVKIYLILKKILKKSIDVNMELQ